MTPVRRILNQYKNKGLTSAEEIAAIVGCSLRRVHYVLEGEKHFWDYEILSICQHFSSMGHNELSKQFLSSKFGLVPVGEMNINGCLLDENGRITQTMGRMMEAFKNREKDICMELCDELIRHVKAAKAECKNLD